MAIWVFEKCIYGVSTLLLHCFFSFIFIVKTLQVLHISPLWVIEFAYLSPSLQISYWYKFVCLTGLVFVFVVVLSQYNVSNMSFLHGYWILASWKSICLHYISRNTFCMLYGLLLFAGWFYCCCFAYSFILVSIYLALILWVKFSCLCLSLRSQSPWTMTPVFPCNIIG